MKYCKRCVIPSTRPNVDFDEMGICSACRNFEKRKDIDWGKRYSAFQGIIDKAKSRASGYDCLIPVSGGKDSTWQVLKCLQYGLNPLAVTWRTPGRTELGRQNLGNLINLGVDHIDYSINPKVEKKFMLASFEKYGSTAIPMHMALFNIPLKIAVNFDIPLVIWGENSAFEYGNATDESKGFKLDAAWLKKYGVTHGTSAKDWVSHELTEQELTPYFGVRENELDQKAILAVFMGYYLPWDPAETFRISREHGFKSREQGPKTGYYAHADIDDDFISIHHYLKWPKFGFTRAFDNLSLEIRNGRMTRQKAVEIITDLGDPTPHEDIEKFCRFVGITSKRFFETAERFRNKDIWIKQDGSWKIKDFLVPDWKWA